jgi:hypothetical protein
VQPHVILREPQATEGSRLEGRRGAEGSLPEGFFASLRMTREALRMTREALRMTGEALRMTGEALRMTREALGMTGEALRMTGEALGLTREALGLTDRRFPLFKSYSSSRNRM